MDYKPNNSLHLSLPNNQLNLDLVLEPYYSSSSSNTPSEPLIFSCTYCQRKFFSSQALGGHQNAHKLERTLSKKSLELGSSVQTHRVSSNSHYLGSGHSSSSHAPRIQSLVGPFEQYGRGGRFSGEMTYGSRDMNYGSPREGISSWYRDEDVQEELSHLDLSLRL